MGQIWVGSNILGVVPKRDFFAGVSTAGGAVDWEPILGGVNILGVVPKRDF